MVGDERRPIFWVASSRKDLRAMPSVVRRTFGVALYAAQAGERPPEAKPLSGFGGAGVLELIEDYRGDTYRAVYTIRFATRIFVLHVFQKKSKRGIATPQYVLNLIEERLKLARQIHADLMKES